MLILLLLGAAVMLHAQNRFTLSGFVREKGSRELLPGVNVYVASLRSGAITNNYGFYSLTLPEGNYEIQFSFVGYQPVMLNIQLNSNITANIDLDPTITLGEVEVVAGRLDRLAESNQMSIISLPVNQVREVPALLGEKDVFKTLQLMPGVQKGREGSSGLYVRGGGPDQNLIILDDATIYNAFHLFGFFSIFNGDALKSIELTKGGFPARFGGRLSSVVEMTMKDGNKETLSGEAGIGLISSRITLEGPIHKNKASFLVSGRRTYLDALIMPFLTDEGRAGYFFYDLNAKLNYDFGMKNKLFISGYFGRDKFFVRNRESRNTFFEGGLFWQNRTATLRWNHLFNNKVFSNTSLIYSQYDFNVYSKVEESGRKYKLNYNSGIRDFSAKFDLEYHASLNYKLRTGLQTTNHHFLPNAIVEVDSQTALEFNSKTAYNSFESAAYAENHFLFGQRFSLNAGLRLTHFVAENKHRLALEPRLSANYVLQPDLSLKLAYADMNQFVHLLSNTGLGLPTDLWVPSTDRVAPQNARQVSVGVAKDFTERGFSATLEGYYKKSSNILGYKPGASFLLIDDPTEAQNFTWQDNVTSGQGWSYGAELLLHKKSGRTNGWIGYTLSWTQLQFDVVNFGKKFFARYDRRHDASVVIMHEINQRISLSASWVYGTGNAVSLPLASFPAFTFSPFPSPHEFGFPYFPFEVSDYGAFNAYRMKPYHRLDISARFSAKRTHYTGVWEVGLYNAYSRRNPYFYYLSTENMPNGNSYKKLKQVSIFPIIPSVSYTIKF
jgi:hypothetical protein